MSEMDRDERFMMSELEVQFRLSESEAEDLLGDGANDFGLLRVPSERASLGPYELESVVLAWAGAVSAATASISFVIGRLRRGVIIDARHDPIDVSANKLLHPGQVVLIDSEGDVSIVEASSGLHSIGTLLEKFGSK